MTSAEALIWATNVVDALGRRMDAGVLRFVAGLHRFGVKTAMSCEGHGSRALPYPWVDIDADSVPVARALLTGLPDLAGFGFSTDIGAWTSPVRFGPGEALIEHWVVSQEMRRADLPVAPAELTLRLQHHAKQLAFWQSQIADAAPRLLEVT
jgi:hypothetical protein